MARARRERGGDPPGHDVKSVLVTGGKGQLGTELACYAWPDGWQATAIDIKECDLADPDAVARIVASEDWAAVINAGAYTAVDRAEDDVVAAWAVNALAPAALAAACRHAAIPIVQISTDYVFDGTQTGVRLPSDSPHPLGVYGASKLAGELAVATSGARHAILRSSWVVSAHGGNFVKTMLRLAGERDSLTVVADQRGCPTGAVDLAAAAATIAIALATDPESANGVWHFSNAGATTWYDFAEAIMAGSAARGGATATVSPIMTTDYPTAARRPANSVLDTTSLTRDFGIRPRPWQDALDDILDALIGPQR